MREKGLAFGILLVFFLQVLIPVVPVDAATSGRTTPDFHVSVMTFSAGGSIDDSGEIKLAPGDHVIRLIVSNQGPVSGDVTLNLVHQASPGSIEVPVTSIDLGTIGGASSSNPILINWTSLSGDDQTLFARVASVSDQNTANDERRIDFDVTTLHRGIVLGDDVPSPNGGFTDVRLDHSVHTFNATVRNDGVMNISAVYELNFTDNSNPSNQMSFWSNTLTLYPGSLLYPANGGTLSATFDAASILGSWTMATKVHFNGTLWNNIIVSSVETVTFSDYIIDVSAPGDRSIEPGATTSLTWIVTNLGITDDLRIELGSDRGWHDDSQEGTVFTLAAGESTTIVVPVTVPSNAVKPTLENVYLNLTSQSPDAYIARSVGHVMVGDQFQATVFAPNGPVTVTPAQTTSLLFTVENTGNVPSAFLIDAGLSASADNWVVIESASVTDVIPAGENVSISVQVTPAPISSPLDPGERNSAGDSIYAWLSATPVDGGIPALNSTQLVMRAVIAVDPGPETEQIILTEAELIEANGTGGIDEIISLHVEVRHNLGSAVTGGVDANITVGSETFVPANSGGFNESARWGSSVTPSSVTGLDVGEIFQSWLAIDGPSDELPLAGELTVPVTATPILTAGQQANGVLASSVTRNISVIIPSVIDGEIITEGPLDADVGNLTNFTLRLANTGNDLSSYRLSIVDDLPDEWSASLETNDSANPSVVTNLTPAMADHPITGDAHISNVTLRVTTDPQAPADTFQPLKIRVEDRDTGELLSIKTLMIRVEESVNFELEPTNHSVELSPYESLLTRVYVNNTGNVATTFSIELNNSQAGDVDFVIESALEIIVAPGYSESIKIRLYPDQEASADSFHMTTLYVTALSTGMVRSASIVANISADHHLDIAAPSVVEVTPGTTEVIDVVFSNSGNLEESLNVTAVIEGNWSSSWVLDQMVLPINGSLENDLTIQIPSLGGESEMANGDIHNVTISLYQSTNGAYLASRTIQLKVAPLFLVEIENWPEEMKYHRQDSRDWRVQITNVGNKEVTVDLTYEVLKPGLEIPSADWEVASGADNSLVLPIGEAVELSFTVEAKQYEPDINLEALLRLQMTPDDPEIAGSSIAETNLKMSRLFAYEDYKLQPDQNDSNLSRDIIWSHIPEGTDTVVSYMIELCGAERRTNITQFEGLSEEDTPWSFALDLGDSVAELDITNDCDSGGAHQIVNLPPRASWVTDNPLTVIIDAPDRPNILKNDGYDLTFRLYHPDDHNGYTVYTEDTFSFYFDTYSEPMLRDLSFGDENLHEGQDSTVTATLRNFGTSIAIQVNLVLQCDGVTVLDPVFTETILDAGEEKQVTWVVTTDYLDWWSQQSDISCHVSLTSTSWDGTLVPEKNYYLNGEVESWSPSVTVSFLATILLIGASFGLHRLVSQNDKFRLAATYTSILALGFAFHLLDLVWWGPAILLVAALWVWNMTWRSTVEFQLIHEDYQRARKGISTLYSEHFEVLTNAKRQLSIILAMPVLGMIGVVLGLPPQMSPDSANMLSLLGYLAVVIGGVVFLVWKANRMYGSLYGRLTEVEVQASRIERDLGDPARLLTELASDGLDISGIISAPRSNVAASGDASSQEVHAWDEDMDEEDEMWSEEITDQYHTAAVSKRLLN